MYTIRFNALQPITRLYKVAYVASVSVGLGRGCQWGIALVSKQLKKRSLVSKQLKKKRYLVSKQQKNCLVS